MSHYRGSGRFIALDYFPDGILMPAAAVELGLLPFDMPPTPAAQGVARAYTIRGQFGRGTTRGGEYVLVSSSIDLSGTTYNLMSSVAPTAWSTTGTIVPRLSGLEFSGTASAGPTVTFAQFRGEAAFVVESPVSVAPSTSVELAALEITVAARVVRVVLALDATIGYMAWVDDAGVRRGAQPLALTPVNNELAGSLGLTFFEQTVWAYVNGALFGQLLGVPDDVATVRIETSGASVRTRFTELAIVGGALVGGRPISSPTIRGTTQVDGLTPAALPSEEGLVDVFAFSPAGVAEGLDAFVYAAPPRKVLIKGDNLFSADVLYTEQDPQVRSR